MPQAVASHGPGLISAYPAGAPPEALRFLESNASLMGCKDYTPRNHDHKTISTAIERRLFISTMDLPVVCTCAHRSLPDPPLITLRPGPPFSPPDFANRSNNAASITSLPFRTMRSSEETASLISCLTTNTA